MYCMYFDFLTVFVLSSSPCTSSCRGTMTSYKKDIVTISTILYSITLASVALDQELLFRDDHRLTDQDHLFDLISAPLSEVDRLLESSNDWSLSGDRWPNLLRFVLEWRSNVTAAASWKRSACLWNDWQLSCYDCLCQLMKQTGSLRCFSNDRFTVWDRLDSSCELSYWVEAELNRLVDCSICAPL